MKSDVMARALVLLNILTALYFMPGDVQTVFLPGVALFVGWLMHGSVVSYRVKPT